MRVIFVFAENGLPMDLISEEAMRQDSLLSRRIKYHPKALLILYAIALLTIVGLSIF